VQPRALLCMLHHSAERYVITTSKQTQQHAVTAVLNQPATDHE
jgi:hypothetical protein